MLFALTRWIRQPSVLLVATISATNVGIRRWLISLKSDPGITSRLQGILTPTTDKAIRTQLHLDDSDTTWLRYTRSFYLKPELEEYGRYKQIMQDSFTTQFTERWPQLVSFSGETGVM